MLGTEPRTLSMSDVCSITALHPQSRQDLKNKIMCVGVLPVYQMYAWWPEARKGV